MKRILLATAALLLLQVGNVNEALADCPAAPLTSTSDMVVSFLAANGTQAAPSTALASSVKEGMLVYDDTANALKVCNGTSWQTLAVGGAGVTAAGTVAGAVQFRGSTGNLEADDTNFVWDDTNNRLGIGTASPNANLKVVGTTYLNGTVEWAANKGRLGTGAAGVPLITTVGTRDLAFATNGASTEAFRIQQGTNALGIGTASPNASALVDISSTTLGFLPPRMTTTDVGNIASPADGLMVYDTDTDTIKLRANGAWIDLLGGSGSEADPQVGTLTANKWCSANAGGTAIDCTADAPATGAAGTSTEIQYRNNSTGAFAADAGLTWDATGKYIITEDTDWSGTVNRVFSSAGGSGPAASLVFVRGQGTAASPTPPLVNNLLGLVAFRSYEETGGAEIRGFAGENQATGARAGYLTFLTTPTGTATPLERMRIDANGNVGIGTSAPVYQFEIVKDAATRAEIKAYSAVDAFQSPGVLLRRGRGTAASPTLPLVNDRMGYYAFGNTGFPTATASMSAFATENHSAGAQGMDLRFSTVADGSTTTTERMRIDENGNVGIGTTTPEAPLHVQKNQAAETTLFVNNTSASGYSALRLGPSDRSTNGDGMVFAGTTTGVRAGNRPLVFQTGSADTERVRIDASGNVGIGQTSPQSLLSVGTGGYAQFEKTFAGAPTAADCDAANEAGRVTYDTTNNYWYVCEGTGGWQAVAASGGGGGGSGNTMISGWPDAIVCSNGTTKVALYLGYDNYSSTHNYYYHPGGSASYPYLGFTKSSGAYYTNGSLSGYDCINKSLSTLVSESKTFNFVGGASASADGSAGEIQFNEGGNLKADSTLVWNNTSKRLAIGHSTPADYGSGASNKIHIKDPAYGYVGIRMEGTGSYAGTDWTLYASSLSAPSVNDFFGIYNGSTADSATEGYKMVVMKTGNVGIGTTAPATLLDVNGTFAVRGSAASYDSLYNYSTNKDVYIRAGTSAGKIVIGDQNTGNVELGSVGSNTVVNGKLGVGTAAPHAKFTVNTGNVNNVGTLDASAGALFGTSTDGIAIDNNQIERAGNTQLFLNYNSTQDIGLAFGGGDVGIGIDAPVSLLHVASRGYAQFEKTFAGTPTAADCDAANEAGRVTYDTTNNYWYVCEGTGGWQAVAASGGGVSADSLDFDDFVDSMALDASTDIAVDGTEVLSITNTGTGNSFRVNDEASDTTPFVIDAEGDVGIGIQVPAYPLHFMYTDASSASGNYYPTFFDNILTHSATSAVLQRGLTARTQVQTTADMTGSITSSYFRADAQNASGTVDALYGAFAQADNSTTGTGTVTNIYGFYANTTMTTGTTPSNYMEAIRGYANYASAATGTATLGNMRGVVSLVANSKAGATVTNADNLFIGIAAETGTITNWRGIYIRDDGRVGATDYAIFSDTATQSRFDGPVGIGDNPENRLTVVAPDATTDQVRLRSTRAAIVSGNTIGGINFQSNDTNLTAPGTEVAAIQALATNTHSTIQLGTALVFKTTIGTTYAEAMRIEGNGNVGIGTAGVAATRKLEVVGDASIDDTLIIDGIGSANAQVAFRDDGTGRGTIGVPNGQTYLSLNASSGFTDHMVISSAAKVGIGTTIPNRKLSVLGDGLIAASTTASAGVLLQTNGSAGEIVGVNHDNNAYNALQFTTSGTPTLFISTGNNVGIGNPSPSNKLDVVGNIAASSTTASTVVSTNTSLSGGVAQFYLGNTGAGGTNWAISAGNTATGGLGPRFGISEASNYRFVIAQGGNVGIGTTGPAQKLDVNGNVIATAYLYASDRRLKDDIVPISGQLDKVSALQPVSFVYKNDDKHEKRLGLIAQDTMPLFPELVHTDDKGMMSIDYAGLVTPLIGAIKELKTQNEKLADQNSQLRTEFDALKDRLNQLEKMVSKQ